MAKLALTGGLSDNFLPVRCGMPQWTADKTNDGGNRRDCNGVPWHLATYGDLISTWIEYAWVAKRVRRPVSP
jgi:hypothetical protein